MREGAAGPVLVYDGHCALCRREAARLQRIAGDAMALESFGDPGVFDRHPELSRDDCLRELKLIHADGRVEGGAGAVASVLAMSGRTRWLGALLAAPEIRGGAARVYGWVVQRRERRQPDDGCAEGGCARHRAEAAASADTGADFRPTARLFLRALGVVYLVAFGSLAVQAHLLLGSDGLLPVRDFLAAQPQEGMARLWRLPTLFWFWNSDEVVRGGTIVGLALALGLILGLIPKLCVVGLWVLFLSYVTAGRDFFWFQWDSLLLETSALALLLPARAAVPPHPWVIFLFQWLVFRLLFESGLAKVQQGAQSWVPLMAMAWYYETAPLPSIGGWFAHQMPLWAHRLTAAATLLGELLVPLLVWARGRALRWTAFVLIVGFQVTIAATANYGYFNLLSAVLALFLLDGRDLRWLPGWLVGRPAAPAARRRWRPLVALAAAAIFLLTVLEFMVLIAAPGVGSSPFLVAVRQATQPFRLANKYHLFAHIDPRRIEAEIEWTADGQEWRPYQLHYKPGPVDRPPPIVAPHQPRLDFQLWFFTMGRDGSEHPYFNTLVSRLCAQPESVRPWFTPASFPDRPPLIVRVAYVRYRMTDRAVLAQEGRYWSRETVGHHPAAHFCDSPTPPRF